MSDSGKNWAINNEIIRKKGKKFAQFFGDKIKTKSQEVKDFYDDLRDLEN